jgi:concanavalin A-like lectin/glucanase superfamily protein
MQTSSQLAMNKKHPDYAGLKVCVPFNRRGAAQVDLVKRDVYSVGAGTPTITVQRGGYAFSSTDVSAYLQSGNTTALWSTDLSVSCQLMIDALAGSPGVWAVGDLGLAIEASGNPHLWNGASVNWDLTASSFAFTTGVWYTIGVRYRSTPSTLSGFYVNGRRYDASGGAAYTASGGVFIGKTTQVNRETFAGKLRDFRVWNRYMPDATFERAHFDPLSFYTMPRTLIAKRFGANLGSFLPFMHPSLQS